MISTMPSYSSPHMNLALMKWALKSCQGHETLVLPLLLNMWYSDRERSQTQRTVMLQLLSRLTIEDAVLLTREHRENLYRELQKRRNDPYLVVAILKGLSGIRDRDAATYIRPLVAGEKCAAGYPAVQEAARAYFDQIDDIPPSRL